jgi:nicotinate phosphoribosyltransferase
MAFGDERKAFEAFAQAMPNNAILLVDTYDTVEGVRSAIEVGRRLRGEGHKFAGIRIDSGDLAYLSIEARRMLDEAGFKDASIAASNDLDERLIDSLKEQGARIDVWGVGTRLITAWDQPALGGVYKLNAVRPPGREWEPRIKLSEQIAKTSNPGLLRVRRYVQDGECIGDVIYDELDPPEGDVTVIDPIDVTRRKTLPRTAEQQELLMPFMRRGRRVADLPTPSAIRERVPPALSSFHSGIKRFINPHRYPAGLEKNLHGRKTDLVMKLRHAEESR